jgi:hypothetical protein
MLSTHSHARDRAGSRYAWQRVKLPVLLVIILVGTQYLSCSKKSAPFQPTDALGIANKWVYDSMK